MATQRGDGIAIDAMREVAVHSEPDAIAEVVTRDIAVQVWPEYCRDADFLSALGRSVKDNARALLATMAGTLDLLDANPEGAFAFAELTAELGIPVSELENAYWVGARGIWREWFALACRIGEHGEADQVEVVGQGTMLIFDYVIHTLGAVVARYDGVRAEILRNREDRCRAMLQQILGGSVTQITSEVENLLGYRLRGTHLALALDVEERAQAERVAKALVGASAARGSMLMLHAPGTWMLWLGFSGDVGPAELAVLAKTVDATGVAMGIGATGAGMAGLRRTCEQALEAAQLRRRLGSPPPVLWFSDVRLELLMLHDEEAARVFVRDELGALASYDERSDRTCETLSAWLTNGSQTDAAIRLGVHKNTMRLRIAHAEEVLAHSLAERRPEIAVALRLRERLRPGP